MTMEDYLTLEHAMHYQILEENTAFQMDWQKWDLFYLNVEFVWSAKDNHLKCQICHLG